MRGAIGAAGAAIGVAGAVAGVAREMQVIDETAKAARKLGISFNDLTAIQHAAAEASGLEGAAVTKAMQKMVTGVSDAVQGTGEAVDALDALGISAEQLNELSAPEQFAQIAEAIKGVSNEQDKLNIAATLFGQRGADMINTLDLGAEGAQGI